MENIISWLVSQNYNYNVNKNRYGNNVYTFIKND